MNLYSRNQFPTLPAFEPGRNFLYNESFFVIYVDGGIEQDDEIICFIAYYLFLRFGRITTIYTEDNYMVDGHDNPLGSVSARTLERFRQNYPMQIWPMSGIVRIDQVAVKRASNALGVAPLADPEHVAARVAKFGPVVGGDKYAQKYLKYKQKYLELKKN